MCWPRVFRVFGWFVAAVLGLAVLGAGGLYVHLAEPHLAYSEWRASAKPEVVHVTYMGYACGEHHPQLYELLELGAGEHRPSETPTTLALPPGMPSPDGGNLAFAGNRFELLGYRYAARRRNRLTGVTEDTRSTRLDVVAWRVEAPYRVLVEADRPGEYTVREDATDPVAYRMADDDHAAEKFTLQRYRSCP